MESTAAARLELVDRLDIRAATDLVESLRGARGRPLEIDAGAVVYVGAQCLQALLAAAQEWRKDGVPFDIVAPSHSFHDCLDALGAREALLTGAETMQ